MTASKVSLFSLPLIAALAGFLSANPARAQWIWDPKMQPLLPSYCAYTQQYRDQVPGGNNPREIEHWNKIMGAGNFWHMHHYCLGLESTHRALYRPLSKQDREHEFRVAIVEFDYVITRVSPDFALLPEILTKKGENLMRMSKAPEAIPALFRAIEMKADYWPPYAALGDYYRDIGNIHEAREWLQKGLAASPGATALQKRLGDLQRAAARR